jgi:hypothetical protein
VAYFLLQRARAAPGEAAHFLRRSKALALPGLATRVPALAQALANVPAFAGAKSAGGAAELRGRGRRGAAAR